jgi:GTP1/Obg family GTP-binding protein
VGTAGSGRYRQPASGASALLRAVVAAPFRVVQVPFRTTDVGVGWVVLARRGAAA